MANHRFDLRSASLVLALAHCAEPPGSLGENPAGAAGQGASDTLELPDDGESLQIGDGEPPSTTTPKPEPEGGQTGDDSGLGAQRCEPAETYALGIDELSPLGFAPSEVLPVALGSFSVPISWLDATVSPYGQVLDLAPRVSSELQLDIERLGSEARVVVERGAEQVHCRDVVEVDVRVRIGSADGALDEELDGVLQLRQGDASLSVSIRGEAIQGNPTFEPTTVLGMPPSNLRFDGLFTRYGRAGTLFQEYGEGDTRRSVQIAEWPIWGSCDHLFGTPVLDERESPTVDGLLTTVRGTKPMTLRGATGVSAAAELDVRAEPQTACFGPAQVISTDPWLPVYDTLTVDAELTLESAALPGPIHLPVRLFGQLARGSESFESASVSVSTLPCGTTTYYSPADFVLECGDWGVDLSGFVSAFLDVYESQFTEYMGYVVFRVRGVNAPGCVLGPTGVTCPDGASGDVDVETVGEFRVYFE